MPDYDAGSKPVYVAVGDLDGINGPDLAVANSDSDDVSVLLNLCAAPACPWDLDGNANVGIIDFLALLAAWGTDPGGPPDFDGDGNTGERLPLDLDGNPRFVDDPNTTDTGCGSGAIVDMGSYEFQAGVAFEANLGDIDGDEVVGINDFLMLLAAWGACADACCLEDLDSDTFVGITDFLLLLGNWG